MFNYTEVLAKAVKTIRETSFNSEEVPNPALETQSISGNTINCQSNLVATFQSQQSILYAFINSTKINSQITLYSFQKNDGKNISGQTVKMNSQIKVGKFGLLTSTNETESSQIILLLGCKEGVLSILGISNKKNIDNLYIDKRGIVDIAIPSSMNNSYCLVLNEDYVTYLVSYRMKAIIGQFKSNYIDCDLSLNVKINYQGQCFMETTEGGYISLWKINQNIKQTIEKAQKNNYKLKDKIHSTFPFYTFHSASIDGLLWSDFFGDFIAIVTKIGQFKIIALNTEYHDDYIVILSYMIPNISQVKQFKINPLQEYLLYCRNTGQNGYLQKLIFGQQLKINVLYRYKLKGMNEINDFWISQNGKYIMAKNDKQFFITKHERFTKQEDHIEKEQFHLNNNY